MNSKVTQYSQNTTPQVQSDSQQDSNSHDNQQSAPQTKDGKKVFELIHQVPIDSIWDQFFTNNPSNFPGVGFDN